MKRVQMCKKVNRNNSFNHLNRKVSHLNAVSPEILVGQIWLQEDEPTAVEIIELNTSDEFDPSPGETLEKRLDHAWSYTNKERLQQIEDNYKINKKARERRRLNNEKHFHATHTATNTNNQFINNNLYSDIVENQYIEDNQLINHQVNCFTIINKHFINSDSSSDADVEIITSNDIIMEHNNWDTSDHHPYNEEIISFDPESGKETRTVWIYSFKNKHLLTEDDYELNNIAVKEMSSCSSSTESDEEQTKDISTNIRRLGSPIPPTYIPRLNLALGPTLSTVTEVSEPNKQSSPNPMYKSPRNRFQKPRNTWVMNESEKSDTGRSVQKLEKSTNVVSWLALSPREKRRRSKELGDKWEGSLLKLETLPTEELLDNNQHHTQGKSGQDNALRLQVDVDVHVSVNEKSPEKRSLGTPNSANVTLKTNTKDKSPDDLLKCRPVGIRDVLDRGDHMKFEQTQQVLCFSGPSHIYETMQPTSALHLRRIGSLTLIEERPMTLDPVLWKQEEKEEKETASYDYLTDKLKCAAENADQAWMKNNAPFLRPSQWDNYAGIAESPLTIQVSIGDVAPQRDPWFKRFLKSINCCK